VLWRWFFLSPVSKKARGIFVVFYKIVKLFFVGVLCYFEIERSGFFENNISWRRKMIKVRKLGKQAVNVEWRNGHTLNSLLSFLNDTTPYVSAVINGKIAHSDDFGKISVPEGADVTFIPLVAGG
jgi:sulfur carrier protein ThiS